MSATMAWWGDQVQLNQSDMRLALNMAKMAKAGFSHAPIQETQYLTLEPLTEVREEVKQGVEFPGHKKLKAAIQRHLAMLRQNHMVGCLPWPDDTAKNRQTQWRRKRAGSPPPNRRRQPTPVPTPEPTLPLPGTPLATCGNTSRAQHCQIVNLPARYVYSHTSLPCAESFTFNTSAQDSQHNTDFDPDMLADEGLSTA